MNRVVKLISYVAVFAAGLAVAPAANVLMHYSVQAEPKAGAQALSKAGVQALSKPKLSEATVDDFLDACASFANPVSGGVDDGTDKVGDMMAHKFDARSGWQSHLQPQSNGYIASEAKTDALTDDKLELKVEFDTIANTHPSEVCGPKRLLLTRMAIKKNDEEASVLVGGEATLAMQNIGSN